MTSKGSKKTRNAIREAVKTAIVESRVKIKELALQKDYDVLLDANRELSRRNAELEEKIVWLKKRYQAALLAGERMQKERDALK